MLNIEKFVTMSPEQWEIVIEGMRNPKNSWDKIDSYITYVQDYESKRSVPAEFFMGKNDHKLAMDLVKGGPVHAKFRRMIPVWFTIKASLFWWKEFDTYKVGTVRNSCSTMHKIHVYPFTIDMFSHDGCDEIPWALEDLERTIETLETLRQLFNNTGEEKYWRAMIEKLPDGFIMKATIMLTYETLAGMYEWRRNHKQFEWHIFCKWIEELPYSDIITGDMTKEVD